MSDFWIKFSIACLVVLLMIFVRNIIAKALVQLIFMPVRKSRGDRYAGVVKATIPPTGWILVGITLSIASCFFTWEPGARLLFNKVLTSLFLACGTWFLYGCCDLILDSGDKKAGAGSSAARNTALHYLAGTIRVILIIVGTVLILEQWMNNLGGLLAGMGIGGAILALAAQDTASNLVAGLAIMLDKPFDLGDWIETKDSSGDISGTVVGIGLRSSRVRSLDGSLLTVPNSVMGKAVLVNGTKRGSRLVTLEVPLDAATPKAKLEAFQSALKEGLGADPEIRSGSLTIYFLGMERQALVWQIRFQTTDDFTVHMQTRHRANLLVLDVLEDLDIHLAQGYVGPKK